MLLGGIVGFRDRSVSAEVEPAAVCAVSMTFEWSVICEVEGFMRGERSMKGLMKILCVLG